MGRPVGSERREPAAGAAPARWGRVVALAPFLSHVAAVRTLGIRPAPADYAPDEREAILRAEWILYPTPRLAPVLEAAGCRCFPTAFTYTIWKDRPLQWRAAAYARIPAPPHRICYGYRAKEQALERLGLPLNAAGPNAAKDPVIRAARPDQWRDACARHDPLVLWKPVPTLGTAEVYCVQGRAVGSRFTAPEGRSLLPPGFSLDGAVHMALQLCREVLLSEAVVRFQWSEDRWLFGGLARPPRVWHDEKGTLDRFAVVAHFLERRIL